MKNIKFVVIGIIALLFLSGCFQVERIIKVNKDGSGTIEETVLMSQEFIDQMKQMAMSFGGSKVEGKRDESEYHNIEDLKLNASKMGEGVEYVSSKPMERDGKLGYHAIYSFNDISKIKIDENPADNMLGNSGMGEDNQEMHFAFKKGSTSELTISFPYEEDEGDYGEIDYEEESDENESISDQDLEMMKAMYAGMKISVKVVVNGKIVKTNATHKEENTIILSEIDFDEIMKDEKSFKALAGSKEASDKEMKRSMGQYSGFKADMNDEIVIKFK